MILVGAVLALAVVSPARAVVASAPIAVQQGATCAYDTTAYSYDVPARLSSPDTVAKDARGSPSRPEAASSGTSASVGGVVVAAESADEFVNLASPSRAQHILTGDATGGGHMWPGAPGKSVFPAGAALREAARLFGIR